MALRGFIQENSAVVYFFHIRAILSSHHYIVDEYNYHNATRMVINELSALENKVKRFRVNKK